MAVTVYLANSWEAADLNLYLSMGWYGFDFGGDFTTTAGYVHKTLSGAGGTYAVHMGLSTITPTVSTNARWLHFYSRKSTAADLPVMFSRDAGQQTGVLFTGSSGVVGIYRGNNGTPLAVSAGGMYNWSVGNWISIYLNAKNSGGTCTVFINGTQVLTYTGDLVAQVDEDWDRVCWGIFYGLFPGNFNDYEDDHIITDDDGGTITTPMRESHAFNIVPNAVVSGNLTGVPTTGANRYQNVDELPVSSSDYNLAAAINDEDLYNLTTPTVVGTVQCLSIYAPAARDGVITKGEIHTVSGASDTYGTATTLPGAPSYGMVNRIHERNPDGDVAWDTTSIGALQVGFRFT